MTLKHLAFSLLSIVCFLQWSVTNLSAQFSKPVCVVKGTIQEGSTNAPVQAHVTVKRNDSSGYVRQALSNSATGAYLVVLDPGAEYSVKVAPEGYSAIDTTIRVASLDQTLTIQKDFKVTPNAVALNLSEQNTTPSKLLLLAALLSLGLLGGMLSRRRAKRERSS